MVSDRRYSASHMGRLDELLEDELELDELEEQLGESVLGLGESCRRVPIFSG